MIRKNVKLEQVTLKKVGEEGEVILKENIGVSSFTEIDENFEKD